MVEKFDRKLLRPDVGIRAVWFLYKQGKWGFLEDFGIERTVVETAFKRFESENVVTRRLTRSQVKKLAASIPGLVEAGRELRLAYALKFWDRRTDEVLPRTGTGGGSSGVGSGSGEVGSASSPTDQGVGGQH